MDTSRRGFLGLAGLGIAAAAITACTGDDDAPHTDTDTDSGVGACTETNPDIEGPFHRDGSPVRNDLDLYGDPGTRLMLTGRVLDADCEPIRDAVVELWQCDDDGEYDNTTAELRYRGQTPVDADGGWWFKTIKPGWYLNGAQYRPAHLHIKVYVDGVEVLTTQLYFEGDPYLDIDPWAEPARAMAIRDEDDGSISCSYDLVIAEAQ